MTAADVATALRFPLAVLFPLVRTPVWQLAIVAAVAARGAAGLGHCGDCSVRSLGLWTHRETPDGGSSLMRVMIMAAIGLLVARLGSAQEFVPPKSSTHGGTRIGLFGFGVRGGVD